MLRSRLLHLFALLIAGLATSACSDDELAGSAPLAVSFEAPIEGEEASALAVGEGIETTPEDRRSLLTLVRGHIDGPNDAPYRIELLRTLEAQTFLDLDQADGPPQWITVAEVVDADGQVLWRDRVNSLFGLLEYLSIVIDQVSPLSMEPRSVYSFVHSNYPQLLDFALEIPLGLEGATDYVLSLPDEEGELHEIARFDIAELEASAEPPQIEGEVVTLLESGPPADRIDVVILGDGYTEAQRMAFDNDVQAVAERLVQTSPLAEHAAMFNIRALWTPSVESGAGYDCTGNIIADRTCKKDLRDTVYEMTFVVNALADKFGISLADTSARVAMPLQVARMYDAAALTGADEIILLSNTNRQSGFAGLYVAVLTAFDNADAFPDVAVHEFGHSFGVLGDEYMAEGDPCLFNEPRVPLPPNIDGYDPQLELTWSPWVAESTPLPTPGSKATQYPVGAFAGAYNCDFLHRPSANCKMRDSGEEFCAVCAEQMVRRLYSVVDPVAHAPARAEAIEGGGVRFTVPTREDAPSEVSWTLGEEVIGDGGETLELEAAQGPATWTKLSATVRAVTPFVRVEEPRMTQRYEWWVGPAGQ